MSVEETIVPKPETEQAAAAETTEDVTKPEAKTEEATVEAEVEIAKRAFALKNYEEAVDHYATALEIARTEYGEDTPSFADLLLKYGRALIENAIAQNSVLGAKQGDEAPKEPNGAGSSSDSKTQPGNGRIHFGDGQSSDDEDGVGDETVDTAAGDLPAVNEEGEGEEQQDEDEPEDDFNAAWDVLDLARAYYDKQEGDDMKLKLSEAYMSLGDVSLETEKFEQAISDYTSGLSIKTQLLPFYSRQACEAHYRLALAFDLTPNKSDGIRHIEQALSSLKARVTVIKDRLESPPDTKGKGKGKGIATNDPIDTMDKVQLQAELKDVEELLNDLSLKHEDMKAAPEAQNQVEDEAAGVKKALDDWLKPSLPAAEEPPQMDGPVNDLSKLVKKKKKPAASALPEAETGGSGAALNSVAAGKRKVEAEEVQDGASPVEKKVKLTTE